MVRNVLNTNSVCCGIVYPCHCHAKYDMFYNKLLICYAFGIKTAVDARKFASAIFSNLF